MINQDNSIKSKINISCVREEEKTLLKNSFFDIPYKVVHYGSKQLTSHLEVMIMCYSPGVMEGDSLELIVDCGESSEMKLFTQSFNKLHPMKIGAYQLAKFNIQKGAILQYLPYPTIPFKDSIFDTINEINVAETAHLIWGDIISGGRIHSGEKFEFTKIHSRTKVFYGKKLIVFDNQLLEPKNQPIESMLFFENYTHQATLIIVSSYAKELKNELDELLIEQLTDLSYGFTLCNENAIMLRVLGLSGDAIHEWLNNIGNMCFQYILFQNNKIVLETNQIENSKKAKLRKATIKKETVKKKPVLQSVKTKKITSRK